MQPKLDCIFFVLNSTSLEKNSHGEEVSTRELGV